MLCIRSLVCVVCVTCSVVHCTGKSASKKKSIISRLHCDASWAVRCHGNKLRDGGWSSVWKKKKKNRTYVQCNKWCCHSYYWFGVVVVLGYKQHARACRSLLCKKIVIGDSIIQNDHRTISLFEFFREVRIMEPRASNFSGISTSPDYRESSQYNCMKTQ